MRAINEEIIAVKVALLPNGLDGLQVHFDGTSFNLRLQTPNHERKKSMIFVSHGQNLMEKFERPNF